MKFLILFIIIYAKIDLICGGYLFLIPYLYN